MFLFINVHVVMTTLLNNSLKGIRGGAYAETMYDKRNFKDKSQKGA